ncbi:MAG TPA: YihY family inner membrane protein [Usitatibacter sp.]|jgi:membrane protein|nr:YihY family inner membrane protein [Usitatibacter sp.]
MLRLLDIARDTAGFARFVLRRWTEDRCPQIAGNLTYTTLLALVPIFTVAVSILSSSPIFAAMVAQVKAFLLLNLAPATSARLIGVYMEDFAANAERLTWTGTAIVLVVSVMMMLIIDRSLNSIWRVHRRRPYWLLVPGYVALFVVGPFLIGAGMAATTFVLSVSAGFGPFDVEPALFRLVSLASTILAFFLVYKVVPHRHVPWRHAVVGSVVAAVLFEAAKELFAVYVKHATTYSLVYGAFAAVPLFLVWLELSWMVVLFGAELTACAGYWHARLWTRLDRPGTRFHEAVGVARELVEAGPAGTSFERLRRDAVLPAHELEDLLARLCEAGIVRGDRRSGYALAGDANAVTVGELYEAAVAPLGGMRPEEWAEISADFAHAAARMREGLERPLAALSGRVEER